MKTLATIAAVASLFTSSVLAQTVDPIVIKGTKFFYKTNGTQFYIKGVAYQQDYSSNTTTSSTSTSNNGYTDPLADEAGCNRDIPYLTALGTNVVRVYAIDPTQNHDACMNAMASAGIYVIADLSAPVTDASIVRDDPQWNDDLYARFTSVIDAMAGYTNTLGFFAGNEVPNNTTYMDSAPFVKAAVRDMKAYIKQKNYRAIGVGYATNDDPDTRVQLGEYMDCSSDTADNVDFYGYNIYSWCGDATYDSSQYVNRTEQFASYSVPVFFAEYGCNDVQPRTFTEVQALYGDQMTPVWSGGIVYMYFQEDNNYGLVSVSGGSVSTLDDYNYLSSQIAQISPSTINAADYTPTNTQVQPCPTEDADFEASTNLPPSPNQSLCQCMYNALSCVPNGVSEDQYGDFFGLVCGLENGVCDGIEANGTTGDYGAYSMCNATEQLGWALNVYYYKQSGANRASACDFSGSATIKSVTSPTGSCSSLISQAGPDGTGSISATSGSGGKGSGNAAISYSTMPVLNTMIPVALYVFVAVFSGAAMILL